MSRFGNLIVLSLVVLTLLLCSFSGLSNFRHPGKKLSGENISVVSLPPVEILHNGDIILRQGRSFISGIFSRFSAHDKRYSHAGLIHLENGKAYVYHIMTGDGGNDDHMRKEPLAVFCSSGENLSYAIYRNSADGDKIDLAAGALYKTHPRFDNNFDFATDDRLYCTELVYKVVSAAAGNENFINLSSMNGSRFVSCDDLYFNNNSKLIFHCTY